MIRLQELEYLIKLCVISPFIDKEKPISLMIIAPAEHGKSELLKKFAFVNTVYITTQFNSFTFSEFALQYPKKRTIIIPDFLSVTQKRHSTSSNAISIINSVTEEGWIGKLPLGQLVDKPITANVLTALTQDELHDKRHKWVKIGFLSRFLPITFSYFEKTKSQIREYIKDRVYTNEEPEKLELDKNFDIILPKDKANSIEKIVLDIAKDNNILGFRLERQLQTLSMCNAVLSQRNIVTDSDIDVIKNLSKFINFKFNQI